MALFSAHCVDFHHLQHKTSEKAISIISNSFYCKTSKHFHFKLLKNHFLSTISKNKRLYSQTASMSLYDVICSTLEF
jgi:hypothetical protein